MLNVLIIFYCLGFVGVYIYLNSWNDGNNFFWALRGTGLARRKNVVLKAFFWPIYFIILFVKWSLNYLKRRDGANFAWPLK